MKSRRLILLATLAYLLVCIGIVGFGYQTNWNAGLSDLHHNNQQQLDQFISHLQARLSRFEFVPELIAKNRLLDQLLANPHDPDLTETVNRFLEDINNVIGASDTYLMDARGMTIAASNWQHDRPFTGQNFSFRPYFSEAIEGGAGRYFALGSTSGKRGYYFSYPITDTAGQIGVVAIKMDLSNIEQYWSGRRIQFMVSDPDGVIFITTRPDWLFRAITAIDKATLESIRLSQRYLDIPILALNFTSDPSPFSDSRILTFIPIKGNEPKDYLSLSRDMPGAGWKVQILAPLEELRRDSLTTAGILLMAIVLLSLLAFVAWLRHKRKLEHERFREEVRLQLEREVELRTADLSREVEDHKQTANTLRETQGELIQTAKLAVLGQMSASISHELNNPLAAIRSYAENARQFLGMNKSSRVDDNLQRIAALTEQMAKISQQLKVFARKSSGALDRVKLLPVIQSASDLVRPQYRDRAIKVTIECPNPELCVHADAIQLEQVLINLLTNAMNAMEQQAQGLIQVRVDCSNGTVRIHVEDEGPGIDSENLDKIFDPFFTTRKSGLGLGLSISARIMENMHGSLDAHNLTQGGARFTVTLQSDTTTSS
jgi:two-component system C4-dicarboxylate transport sensor histidine kinase DctB